MESEESNEAEGAGDSELRRRVEGVAALFFVQLFFGAFPVFIKFAFDEGAGTTPRALAVWRMAFGALVLSGCAAVFYRGRLRVARADLGRLLVCAFLGIFVNVFLALEGVKRTTVTNSGLLFTLIPVFTYALAMLFRQERYLPRRVAGIGIAMAGAIVLVLSRGAGGLSAGGDEELLGSLLIVTNCAAYAGYLVLVRPLLARYPSLVVIAWVFVLSLVFTPILAVGQDLAPTGLSERAWLGIGYSLVFPTVVAYLLNMIALARVSASTAAVFIYLQPLIAGAGGVLVFGETLGPSVLLAASLLFVGIALVTWRRRAVR